MGKKKEVIQIDGLKIEHRVVVIKGISPIIFNRFTDSSRESMKDYLKKNSKSIKKIKGDELDEEVLEKMYVDKATGHLSFPAEGFKKALLRGGKHLGEVMTDTGGALHINNLWLVPLSDIEIREDLVTNSNGSKALRKRPTIVEWKAVISLEFDRNYLTDDNRLLNMIQMGGYYAGLGEWRPERKGSFGRFVPSGEFFSCSDARNARETALKIIEELSA